MRHHCWLLAAVLLIGCSKSSGPLVLMDGEAIAQVERVAILPLANTTGFDVVNPLVERLFLTELTGLKRFEFIEPDVVVAALDSLGLAEADFGNPFNLRKLGNYLEADAVIGAAVTTYSPFGTEAVLLGRQTEKAEKEIKPPRGIVGWFVPSKVSVSETQYQYGTVAKDPAIGAVVVMINASDARVIYEASKFIQGDARVPGTYKLTYGGLLSADDLRRVDFIGRLVVKELLEPLRREL